MTLFPPLFVTALCPFLALTACMEPTRLSPDAPRDNTKTAASIGSVMGAAAGLMSAERRSKVLKGAIIGGGLGLVAGSLLDRQEADLRRDLGNRNVEITNTGEQLIVTLPQDILFATDRTAIWADLQRDLKVLANNLQAYPKSTLTIIGHTDNVGDAGYNSDLSNRRAFSVETVLLDAGTSLGRMNAYGRGEEQPLASNLTAQ